MATWYVRPDTSHNSTRNGTSYATAWGGWPEIIWGASGFNAGDTLYVCGQHSYTASIAIGAHGASSDSNRVVIRGDYAADPGTLVLSLSAWIDCSRRYTTIKSLTITSTAAGFNCIYVGAPAGIVVDGCTLTGGIAGVGLGSNVAFTSLTIKNCNMSGQSTAGINQNISVASIVSSGITITGNTIHDTALYGVNFAITSTNNAWSTSSFADYFIANNTVYNTAGSSIYLRSCNNDFVTFPTIYSSGLAISGNTIYNCGTIAGPNGKHGGIQVMGFDRPVIASNTVRDCYVTGGGVQTLKNRYPFVMFNTISRIRAGTPTNEYQSGLPIDGNGIFFDVLTIGGLAFGNYISDLISTGLLNSGTALSFWNCTGAKFFGNIIENCYAGASYGHANEKANEVYNNTFINCDYGVVKIGAAALAGALTVKNNIIHNSPTGFLIGPNPSITADYNCVYGGESPYVGISAGANDVGVNPMLDTSYRPQATALKRTGASVTGNDFYGKQFYSIPNIGAVDDQTTTPRYLVTSPDKSTR